MEVQELHSWDVSPAEAVAIQQRLRSQVTLHDTITMEDIRVVAGVDNSYQREGSRTTAIAAVVVFQFPDLTVLETVTAAREVVFPYVPGLLSFREAPAIVAACRELTSVPDVMLFDGQGYAHPRRMGLATHLGLVLGTPSIGCAKSRLVGGWEEPAQEFGAHRPLVHRDEVVGAAVRTRPGHAPLFVSPGHMLGVDTAVRIVLACCRAGRFMPEPTRLAHNIVTAAKQERKNSLSSADE